MKTENFQSKTDLKTNDNFWMEARKLAMMQGIQLQEGES
jgi:hypothetical protein